MTQEFYYSLPAYIRALYPIGWIVLTFGILALCTWLVGVEIKGKNLWGISAAVGLAFLYFVIYMATMWGT